MRACTSSGSKSQNVHREITAKTKRTLEKQNSVRATDEKKSGVKFNRSGRGFCSPQGSKHGSEFFGGQHAHNESSSSRWISVTKLDTEIRYGTVGG